MVKEQLFRTNYAPFKHDECRGSMEEQYVYQYRLYIYYLVVSNKFPISRNVKMMPKIITQVTYLIDRLVSFY